MKQEELSELLLNQFGAAIDMLENAIEACPDDIWDDERRFWYNAFHCLFFLDFYLSTDAATFLPPLPFDESEFEDRMPSRTYTKTELIEYSEFCRVKCRVVMMELTDETAGDVWSNVSQTMKYPIVELLMYNMRHVQHHAAQLNLLLRQSGNTPPDWVSRAGDES